MQHKVGRTVLGIYIFGFRHQSSAGNSVRKLGPNLFVEFGYVTSPQNPTFGVYLEN
jgi:hypothetical protein